MLKNTSTDLTVFLKKNYREVLGDRPQDSGAIRNLPFYYDANSLYQSWLTSKD